MEENYWPASKKFCQTKSPDVQETCLCAGQCVWIGRPVWWFLLYWTVPSLCWISARMPFFTKSVPLFHGQNFYAELFRGGVQFRNHMISSLLFAGNVVMLALSSQDLYKALG